MHKPLKPSSRPPRHRCRSTRAGVDVNSLRSKKKLDPGTDSRVYFIIVITNGCLRSGELARIVGVSTDTLRHYERKGLLTSKRSPNGYREYPPSALTRVNLVQHALSVGFSLDELSKFLKVRDRGGAPCHEVRALAAKKLEDLDARIRDLQQLRNDLRVLLAEWDARLESVKDGGRALLLESLTDGTNTHRSHNELGGKRRP
jgi:DNA-binding transcriptional MerR regulator